MGIFLSCLVGEAVCCCAGSAIKCCCCLIPTNNSHMTKFIYSLFFILTTITAYLLSRYGILIQSVKNGFNDSCGEQCWEYFAVDRVGLGFILYHAFLCILTIGVKQRFWPIKIMLLVGAVIGSFFIPIENYQNFWISTFVFSMFFLLIQAMILVDFAWDWSSDWVSKMKDYDASPQFYKSLLVFFTFIFYALVITLSSLLYVYYTPSGCGLNTFFITFNLILIVAMSCISILPKIQEIQPKSGIFQAAFLSLYCTWLIASALSSEPNDSSFHCAPFPPQDANPDRYVGKDTWSVAMMISGILISFLAICYQAWSTGSEAVLGDLSDEDETSYHYSWFHFIYFLAGNYMVAVLTNWSSLTNSNGTLLVDRGLTSMWIKVSTSWLCFLLYIWTLVAPLIFPDREFS